MSARARKQDAFAKAEIFNQTEFSRIIYFDSHTILLKHTDELFLLPSSPVAMPRAYWKFPSNKSLTPSFMVIEPSEAESARITESDDFDRLYGDTALVLPHRQYALVSGEFRAKNHSNYFGNEFEQWDPDRAVRSASLIHFADWPLPKPWVMWPLEAFQEMRPSCEGRPVSGKQSCRDREIWMKLYGDFRIRRKVGYTSRLRKGTTKARLGDMWSSIGASSKVATGNLTTKSVDTTYSPLQIAQYTFALHHLPLLICFVLHLMPMLKLPRQLPAHKFSNPMFHYPLWIVDA